MTGPIEQMAQWQQMLVCSGLFAAMLWLYTHPAKTTPSQKVPIENDAQNDVNNDARRKPKWT